MDSDILQELKELKNLNPGSMFATRHLEKALEALLKLEQRLDESCASELNAFNVLVSIADELKSQVLRI